MGFHSSSAQGCESAMPSESAARRPPRTEPQLRLGGSAHELWYRPVAPSAPPGHRAPAPNVHQQPAKTNRLGACYNSKTNYSFSPKGEIVFAAAAAVGPKLLFHLTQRHSRVLPWRLLITDSTWCVFVVITRGGPVGVDRQTGLGPCSRAPKSGKIDCVLRELWCRKNSKKLIGMR